MDDGEDDSTNIKGVHISNVESHVIIESMRMKTKIIGI